MIENIIRWIFTAVLLFFVYGETGWATTLYLALVALDAELKAMALNKFAGWL